MSTLSAQVNFVTRFGVKMTATPEPETVLEHAKVIEDRGNVVTSIAIYRYPASRSRKVETVALWFRNGSEAYWGQFPASTLDPLTGAELLALNPSTLERKPP